MENITIPICILLALLSAACKPKSDCTYDPPLELHLSAEDLSYFDFPVGAWWVFENDSTGDRDSVYVVSNVDSRIANPDEVEGCISSYADVKTVSVYSTFYAHQNINTIYSGEHYNSGSFEFGGDGTFTFFSPSFNSQSVGDSSLYKIDYSDSIIILNKIFYDVTSFRTSWFGIGPPINKYYNGTFYYAKNIGLIKWNLEGSDTIWSVINYGEL